MQWATDMLPLKSRRGVAYNCTPRLSDMHLADALVEIQVSGYPLLKQHCVIKGFESLPKIWVSPPMFSTYCDHRKLLMTLNAWLLQQPGTTFTDYHQPAYYVEKKKKRFQLMRSVAFFLCSSWAWTGNILISMLRTYAGIFIGVGHSPSLFIPFLSSLFLRFPFLPFRPKPKI